ncbi:ThiF family adenylyltransferase [Nonomuraea typhae]|uniref:ThiF family adenylyltransferase n=1 Tax=Nonomuraea typhae TaxID=2603600 RepID=UPI0012FBA2E4|nr:ThiF family adenylyltransferase [Nonomuraea typhae]
MRPRVKPALRRVLRDERTLQFGVHPQHAVMVTDLTEPLRVWIESLDGTQDLSQALKAAAKAGMPEPDARTLIAELTAQGVLDDASVPPTPLQDLPLLERDRLRPDLDALDLSRDTPAGGLAILGHRRERRVRVYGAGRVGASIVNLLAASGVGTIRVIDPALTRPEDLVPGGLTWAELDLPREEAAVAAADRVISAPSSHNPAPDEPSEPYVRLIAGGPYLNDRSDLPDLVILAPVGPLDGILVTELTALNIPHLLVSAFEGYGTVGPLVHPSQSACLHCLDLTRRDRDRGWPMVTAHLGGYPAGEIACDTTLATLTAAEATRHALAYLDGRPSIVTNGTIDIWPDWQRKRRTWAIHPQCRCIRNNPDSLRMVRATTRG